MDQETFDYYRLREERERSLAHTINPAVAAIHLAMADHYRALLIADGRMEAATVSDGAPPLSDSVLRMATACPLPR